jgi:hypothetical protein
MVPFVYNVRFYVCGVASNVHCLVLAWNCLFSCSFIKDLNGLEIVIMYISVLSVAHKVHHKHMGKEQGSVLVC